MAAGGSIGAGGAATTGGAPADGGATATSKATAGGGTTATSGDTATGGIANTGGASASGGFSGTGGAQGADAGSPADAAGPLAVLCQQIGLPSDWCSCDLWGKFTKADTSFFNNIWGSGAGSQCIWVDSKSWGALASHPSTGGVKAYPNVSVFPRKIIGDIKTYTSSFDITVPTGGAWDAAYDLTLRKDSTVTTVMLWVNHTEGRVFPKSSTSSPVISGVAVGGHVWNVYYAREGVFDIISFLRTGNVSAATVDIKAILGWLVANMPPLDATWTLDQLQFGFEIVANDAPQRFTCNRFSVSSD